MTGNPLPAAVLCHYETAVSPCGKAVGMEDNLTVHQVDIVIVAKHHNPSILNPDFLERNGIVREEWAWKRQDPVICTPALAEVNYDSGFSVQAQLERLIFSEKNPARIPEQTHLADVAAGYVKTLPHMKYTSVGVNPKAHYAVDDVSLAREFILSKLVKDGPWKSWGARPVHASARLGASVRLVLGVSDATLFLSVDAGEHEGMPSILFRGNFRRDLKPEDHDACMASLASVISNWRKDYETFLDVTRNCILAGGMD